MQAVADAAVRWCDRRVALLRSPPRTMKPSRDIARLIEIMAALRTPGTGCPWDLEQTFRDHRALHASKRPTRSPTRSRAAISPTCATNWATSCCRSCSTPAWPQEQGAFDFGDVVEAITDQADPPASACVRRRAAGIRRSGRRALGADQGRGEGRARRARSRRRAAQALAGVPVALPALPARSSCRHKAGKVGFDWNDPARGARQNPRGSRRDRRRDRERQTPRKPRAEVGDLLFAVVNLARHLDGDPEATLRATNQKFERRFAAIERALARAGQGCRRTRRSPRWMRSGTRPRRRNATADGAAQTHAQRVPARCAAVELRAARAAPWPDRRAR